jgi:hypothetical protein
MRTKRHATPRRGAHTRELTIPAHAQRYWRDTLADAMAAAEGVRLDLEGLRQLDCLRRLARQTVAAEPEGALVLLVPEEDRERVRSIFRRQASYDTALLDALRDACGQGAAAALTLDRIGFSRSMADELAAAA